MRRNVANPFQYQTLESRNLLATISLDPQAQTVTIFGSNGDDNIQAQTSPDYRQITITAASSGQPTVSETILFRDYETLIVWAGAGDDVVDNSSFLNSYIAGHAGNDTLNGGYRDDQLYGGPGNDTINARAGNDTAAGQAGNDAIWGFDGEDLLYGNNGRDILFGGNDDDSIFGGNQADRIEGDSGNDTLNGNRGNDLINGSEGDDRLMGNSGDDRLHGGDGNDRLFGHSGHDRLFGDAGLDGLFGGIGSENDELVGGPGSDRFLLWEFSDRATDITPREGIIRLVDNASGLRFGAQAYPWTEAEIEVIDDGLAQLHMRAQSSSILRDPSNESPTKIVKTDGGNPRSIYGGINQDDPGQRKIAINLLNDGRWRSTNRTFSPDDAAQRRVLTNVLQHEIGHNFDTESEIQNILPGTKLLREFRSLQNSGVFWTGRNLSFRENFANAVDSTANRTSFASPNARTIAELFDRFYAGLAETAP